MTVVDEEMQIHGDELRNVRNTEAERSQETEMPTKGHSETERHTSR